MNTYLVSMQISYSLRVGAATSNFIINIPKSPTSVMSRPASDRLPRGIYTIQSDILDLRLDLRETFDATVEGTTKVLFCREAIMNKLL